MSTFHAQQVQAIRDIYFPRLLKLRHRVLLDYKRPTSYVFPSHADPGPDPTNKNPTTAPAYILGLPLVFEGEEGIAVILEDGSRIEE